MEKISFIKRIFSNIIFLKDKFFFDKYEKKFIKYNLAKWSKEKNIKSNGIVLIDLFYWGPWIYFWSYLASCLRNEKKLEIRFFYFHFFFNKFQNFNFFKYKLIKIYNSMNIFEGINEINFKYKNVEYLKYKKLFFKIKSKNELVKFKIHNVLIGDLIYDTYLRTTFEPTIILSDPRLKKIFIRSLKIFFETLNFFKHNKVEYVVPSHLCYTYGIIARIALKKKIKVIKLRSENWGSASFQLIKVNKYCLDEQPYYDYKNHFKKIDNKEKVLGLKIGKKIIQRRVKGNFDKNLPYINKSQFSKLNIKRSLSKNKLKKGSIIIFPHCFYDYPHRYRSMIFNDYYEHALFFLNQSKKFKNYQWYYKPHPNSLSGHFDFHKLLLNKFPEVKFLNKDVSHREIIKLKPKCIITNHGTIAHEYAYHNILSINTGDNPHINYNFCLNVNSKKKLTKIFNNIDYYRKQVSFDKNKIYEFLYMHYIYYKKFYNRNLLINDSFFSKGSVAQNKDSKILNYLIKSDAKNSKNIKKYISNFINNKK